MAPPPERRSPLTHRVLLLGAAGYVGRAFARALDARGIDVVAPSRRELDATRFRALRDAIASARPALVINAAGFTGQPNVDACETARADTVLGNVTLPLTVAHACDAAGVPLAHVSSGCIYSGAKLIDGDASGDGAGDGDGVHVVKDLLAPDAQRRIAAGARIAGFVEVDAPNFTFRDPPCSFYSGTKALAEELLAQCERT